jgi:hypothetical protein
LVIADLCHKCHYQFDVSGGGETFEKKIDKSEQFLFNIVKTLIRRIDQGVITIEGMKDE